MRLLERELTKADWLVPMGYGRKGDPLIENAITRRLMLGGGLLLPGCGLGPTLCGGSSKAVTPPPAMGKDVAARALLDSIDTFVVVMLENRSFDHLLGGLKLDNAYANRARLLGLNGTEQNPDGAGGQIQIARLPGDGRGSINPTHHWQSARVAFNAGGNDRFAANNPGPAQAEVMSYLARDQVPYFHALADRFTIFDNWFSSYMGQTWPNRYFLHATTSQGQRNNRPLGLDAPLGVWERMAERCLSTRNYTAGSILWYTAAFPTRMFSGDTAMVPGTIEDFFRDARTGNLPNLSVIDPDFKVNDAYPLHSPVLCEAFVSSIVTAMAESPQWGRSLLLITFDENGGYFDHVPPPLTVDPRPEFRQLGFRVPAFAIGPTVYQGGVVSTQLEHVSVAATMRARFGIASLGPRMDATADVSDCIDPARLGASLPPPRNLPAVEVTQAQWREAGQRLSSQTEMEQALADHSMPESLVDKRSDEQRRNSWLRAAQELDAVKVRG